MKIVRENRQGKSSGKIVGENRRGKPSGKIVGAMLAVVLGSASPAAAQGITKQTCNGQEPVGTLGISGIDCDCTIASPGSNKPWSFRSEPKITSLEKGTRGGDLLKIGDVITHVNDKPVTSPDGAREFANIKPGEAVILTIRRSGQKQVLAFTADAACPASGSLLGIWAPSRPQGSAPSAFSYPTKPTPRPDVAGKAPAVAWTSVPRSTFGMGLSCSGNCSMTFSDKQAKFSKPPEVYSIEKGGPADKAGIRRGDVLTHINDLKIDSEKGGNLFANVKPGEVVRFTISRDGERRTVAVTAAARTPAAAPQLAQSSEALVRARESLTQLQRQQEQQMRKLQEDLRKSQQMEQEQLREMQRQMLRAEQEHRAKLAELGRELSRADSRVKAAIADSMRTACPVPLISPSASSRVSRTLRYTGNIANAEIEVRGSNPVSVTETGDEVVITTGGTVVRVKKSK